MAALLVPYEVACRAIAEAVAVDDVKGILDAAAAMRTYAKRAKNRDMEANAVEIRMRCTRRIGQLLREQRETVGLATGGEHGGRARKDGLARNPSIVRPTIAMQGIDKTLAQQGRVLDAVSEEAFEHKVVDARGAVARAYKNVINAAAIEQERESYRQRTDQGGRVDDLHALIASGYRAGVIYCRSATDVSNLQREGEAAISAERHYDVMSIDEIKALPVAALAAKNCALLMWDFWPEDPEKDGELVGREIIKAWEFNYRTAGFIWVKTTRKATSVGLDGKGLHWGMGYHTRTNTEALPAGGARLAAAAGERRASSHHGAGRRAFGEAGGGRAPNRAAVSRSVP